MTIHQSGLLYHRSELVSLSAFWRLSLSENVASILSRVIDSELARVGERAGLLALGIATMVTIFLVGHFSHSPC
jgi:hypothetical protein